MRYIGNKTKLLPFLQATIRRLGIEPGTAHDAFAGTAPAPGGAFAHAAGSETSWGPVLANVTAWVGARVESLAEVGWARLVTATIEHVQIDAEDQPLVHRRGRYQRPG